LPVKQLGQNGLAPVSDSDLPAHQARQKQVPCGAELSVLETKRVRLRKQRLGLLIEGADKRGAGHDNLGALEVAYNYRWICRPAGVVLQVTDE
jgi:hypothetical protein